MTGAQLADAVVAFEFLTRAAFGRITSAQLGAEQVDSVVCDEINAVTRAWVADASTGLASVRATLPLEPAAPACPAKEDGGPCTTTAVCTALATARAALSASLCPLRKMIRSGWDKCWDSLRLVLIADDDAVVSEHLEKCRSFKWHIGEWGETVGECPGVQSRTVTCKDGAGVTRGEECCAAGEAKHPVTREMNLWPVEWRAGGWGVCSGECGQQQRDVWCACTPSGAVVPSAQCDAATSPSPTLECGVVVRPDPLRDWAPEPCECGGQQTAAPQTCTACTCPTCTPRPADCREAVGVLPSRTRACEGVHWRRTGRWGGCSGPCGHQREVLECASCDGAVVPSARCSVWPIPPVGSRDCEPTWAWEVGKWPATCRCQTVVERALGCRRCGVSVPLQECRDALGRAPRTICRQPSRGHAGDYTQPHP